MRVSRQAVVKLVPTKYDQPLVRSARVIEELCWLCFRATECELGSEAWRAGRRGLNKARGSCRLVSVEPGESKAGGAESGRSLIPVYSELNTMAVRDGALSQSLRNAQPNTIPLYFLT